MTIALVLGTILIAFLLMFYYVQPGRLTHYWVAIDLLLVDVRTLSEFVLESDLTLIASDEQQVWVTMLATGLLFVARARSAILESKKGS